LKKRPFVNGRISGDLSKTTLIKWLTKAKTAKRPGLKCFHGGGDWKASLKVILLASQPINHEEEECVKKLDH